MPTIVLIIVVAAVVLALAAAAFVQQRRTANRPSDSAEADALSADQRRNDRQGWS